jgi:hypothetical protein
MAGVMAGAIAAEDGSTNQYVLRRVGAPDKIRTCDLCLRRANCGLESCVNVHLPMGPQRTLTRGRIRTNPRGWSPVSFGCRECSKRAPATIVPGSLASAARGAAGSPANCISGRFPQPVRINRRRRPGSADHRTSFAPETIATRRNKHDRTRQISMKINASNSYPAAHNGSGCRFESCRAHQSCPILSRDSSFFVRSYRTSYRARLQRAVAGDRRSCPVPSHFEGRWTLFVAALEPACGWSIARWPQLLYYTVLFAAVRSCSWRQR